MRTGYFLTRPTMLHVPRWSTCPSESNICWHSALFAAQCHRRPITEKPLTGWVERALVFRQWQLAWLFEARVNTKERLCSSVANFNGCAEDAHRHRAADRGGSYCKYRVGNDAALMPLIDSPNIACGVHAGESPIMVKTVRLALENGG